MNSEDATKKVLEAHNVLRKHGRDQRSWLEDFRRDVNKQAEQCGWYSDARFNNALLDFEKDLRNL